MVNEIFTMWVHRIEVLVCFVGEGNKESRGITTSLGTIWNSIRTRWKEGWKVRNSRVYRQLNWPLGRKSCKKSFNTSTGSWSVLLVSPVVFSSIKLLSITFSCLLFFNANLLILWVLFPKSRHTCGWERVLNYWELFDTYEIEDKERSEKRRG